MVWRTDKPTGPAIVAKLTDDFCFGHGRYTILYLGTVDTLGVTTKCYLEDGEEIPDSAIEKWASLEEDKVSDDLEKAANNFSESDPPLYGSRYYWDSESLFGKQIETTFKAGAHWQELKDIQNLVNSEKPCKVEPKFKIGDWITNNIDTDKIIGIDLEDENYLFENGGKSDISLVESISHIWTIQDAKDGDVLAEHETIVLFKKIEGQNIRCYCTYHYLGYNPALHVDTLQNKKPYLPATQEQHDLLFQKMKEAGYEWDTEKKELKKVEQKPTDKVEPKFKVGDKITEKDFDECCCGTIIDIKDGKYIFDNGGFVCIEEQGLWQLVEQKPADKDELFDHRYAQHLVESQRQKSMIQWKGDNLKEVIDFTGKDRNFDKWFKSFEEYEQYVQKHNGIFKLFNTDGSHYEIPVGAWIVKTPDGYNVASKAIFKQNPTWSKEDEEMLRRCISATFDHGYLKECDWLKTFKERVQPQSKQEWSEEDMMRIDNLIAIIENRGYPDYVEYLEKLKERYTWKPSDEQMDALKELKTK